MNIRVRRVDGWTIATFPGDVERVGVSLAPGDGGVMITLVGVRNDAPNHLELGILDVEPADESKLDTAVPRHNGIALPLVARGVRD